MSCCLKGKYEKELEEEKEEELVEIVPGSCPKQLLFFVLLISSAIPMSCWVVYRMQKAMDNHQVSTIPVLKFSSGGWQVPTPGGHRWTPRTSVTHSRHPTQLLSQAPPSCCQEIAIFHHLLPQLNLHQCPTGQRLWVTKTETPQGHPVVCLTQCQFWGRLSPEPNNPQARATHRSVRSQKLWLQ